MAQERKFKVAFEYAGRQIKAGKTAEVEAEHIALLLAMGKIEPEEGDAAPAYSQTGLASAVAPAPAESKGDHQHFPKAGTLRLRGKAA